MKTIRIIPRLDIKGPNLVKGVHLEGLRVLGKPEQFAKFYYESGADELLYMDVVASLYGRNHLLDIIARTSREIFIPLTVGGGLRSLDDMQAVLRAGADKVSINTCAISQPEIIKHAARKFGSSTIVVSVEAIKKPNGTYEAYTENGRQETGLDAVRWAIRAAELGAGEILLTSINQEGTGDGFDLELTALVAGAVSIPVIACGGAGSAKHVASVITEGKADAVSIASIFHYEFIKENRTIEGFTTEGNVEFLRSGRGFSKFETTTVNEIKKHLSDLDIPCRYPATLKMYG